MTTVAPAPATQRDRLREADVRVEADAKVSGQMIYAADCRPRNVLWAAFTESPFAHARIRSVDVRPALAIPGVRVAISAADIGPHLFGRAVCDWPILASETVRFIGDRVAAVAAETREAAAEAARTIVVEYEELPPVIGIAAALALDAPVLHPAWHTYDDISDYAVERPPRDHPNIYAQRTIRVGAGDLDAIFAGAVHVFEHHFATPRQVAGYIEPRATTVWIAENGVVHLISTNKGPYAFRKHFAHAVGLAESDVVIESVAIGGDFGGKGLTTDELPCYFLARASGRPVRYVATYTDELRRGPTRHAAELMMRTAVAADGAFLAHVSTVSYDGGAYAATKPIPNLLPGPGGYPSVQYRVPEVRIDLRGVYTTTLPGAHVRGPASVQVFFAWERHIDRIARALGADPIALRVRNMVRDGDISLTGERIRRPTGVAVLERLRDASGPPPLRADCGRGISIIAAHTGSGKTAVRVRLHADGSIDAIMGTVDQGAGAPTVVRRVIGATLDIPFERIAVRRGTSAEAPSDPGPGHSRITHIAGRAALDAAEQLLGLLAQMPGETYAERAAAACRTGPIEIVGRFASDHGSEVPGDLVFAAYAVDVRVDRETGAVHIERVTYVMDAGQIISPIAHQGQIEGGFIMGLGSALMEDVTIDANGRVGTPSLGEYKMPVITDMPPLRVEIVEAHSGNGPYGTRMVGELANVGVPPAVANAVAAATGVELARFPVTAESVYDGLMQKQNALR